MLPIKKFFRLVKKTLGLVHTSDNLPDWQAVKLTFFAPCLKTLFGWGMGWPFGAFEILQKWILWYNCIVDTCVLMLWREGFQ